MSTPPFQSKLIPYQKDLFRMWYKDRATLKQLQAWLETQGVTISLSAISRFIRSRKRSIDPHESPPSLNRKTPASQDGVATAISKLEELMK